MNNTHTHADISLLNLISSADFTSQIILLILLSLSVYSWSVIARKYFSYKSHSFSFNSFAKEFWSGKSLEELKTKAEKRKNNCLAIIFCAGMKEYKISKSEGKISEDQKAIILSRITKAMQLASQKQQNLINQNLSSLATIGSTAPFIGLFGTVYGIMHSFSSIAMSKNTSLAIVAPGIAEALLATAIGLFVAIPAVWFYNNLVNKADDLFQQMDEYIGEMELLFSRAIYQ